MTFSMTGYGKAVATHKGRIITVEIRTLNSKQGDLNVRMPSIYRSKEIEMRSHVSSQIGRGKVDLTIQRDLAEAEASNQINQAMVQQYYAQLKTISEGLEGNVGSADTTAYLRLIMQLPDVLKPISEELDQAEYEVLQNALDACIAAVNDFRAQEGKKLEEVLRQGCETIITLLSEVEPFESDRIDRIRQRIGQNLEEHEGINADKDRFEQELIYYLEKLDVTEEKVRLKAHCEYFFKTLQEGEEKGKKLSFIAQEMGREINTLGSKAQHAEIQRIVVRMKDELEKIKEQVLNVR